MENDKIAIAKLQVQLEGIARQNDVILEKLERLVDKVQCHETKLARFSTLVKTAGLVLGSGGGVAAAVKVLSIFGGQ